MIQGQTISLNKAFEAEILPVVLRAIGLPPHVGIRKLSLHLELNECPVVECEFLVMTGSDGKPKGGKSDAE